LLYDIREGGYGMPGEKRFRTSFMGGFKKSDVNTYIEKILREFEEKLKEKDDEIAALKSQYKDVKSKYEELQGRENQINEDRAKISEVLIKAQEKADLMLEDARIAALEEKRQLEETIEKDKERLVDIRKEIKTLKDEIVSTLKKYDSQLEAYVREDQEDQEDQDGQENEEAG
jgi:chromosome segregation ATPase